MSLLIAGGQLDPNLTALASAAHSLQIPVVELRHRPSESPGFDWNLQTGEVEFFGQSQKPTAAFIRHDVFEGLTDHRPQVHARSLAWHQAVYGWVLAHKNVKFFNRSPDSAALSKPAALMKAREVGLQIPTTRISNVQNKIFFAADAKGVVKPVAGGDYCYEVSEALERTSFQNSNTPNPAILQQKLVPPEVRIFVVGEQSLGYKLMSTSLDYRLKQDAEISEMEELPAVTSKLRLLIKMLNLDYGAADFKTDPASGELVFLEFNTSPMFARFDQISNGRLAKMIIQELIDLKPCPF